MNRQIQIELWPECRCNRCKFCNLVLSSEIRGDGKQANPNILLSPSEKEVFIDRAIKFTYDVDWSQYDMLLIRGGEVFNDYDTSIVPKYKTFLKRISELVETGTIEKVFLVTSLKYPYEKSLLKKLALKLFMCNPRYKNIKNKFEEELAVISKLMEEVNTLERINANFDLLSNSFGEFFAEIFRLFFHHYKMNFLELWDDFYSLCFNFGKWIYIMDAYDDYIEDNKSNDFNLLNSIMQEDNSPNKIEAHKKIYIINKMLLYKMREAYYKIDWNKHGEIIYNMITVGCTDTYWSIVHMRYPQIESVIK